MESSVVCAVSGKSTLLQSHAITLPYFASFTPGEVGRGGEFRWSFSVQPNKQFFFFKEQSLNTKYPKPPMTVSKTNVECLHESLEEISFFG